MWAIARIWAHATGNVWVSRPALNLPHHIDPAHSKLRAGQLQTPLTANSSHSQLTHSHSCSPTFTFPWVSIHSDIAGRNNAVQWICSQRRSLLTPFVVWAVAGIWTHIVGIRTCKCLSQPSSTQFQRRGRQSVPTLTTLLPFLITEWMDTHYNMVRWISTPGTMHFCPRYDTFWPCGLFTLLQFCKHPPPPTNQHETEMSK